MSHTAGPWEIHESRTKGFCIVANGKPVVCCQDEFDHYGAIPLEADACLIASAPILLSALKRLAQAGRDADIGYLDGAVNQAFDAIELATGCPS